MSIVVTLSHESEEIVTDRIPSYAENQFVCTKNIECPDWFTEYLFGGMQYQLEHHLFPTLPRYKHRYVCDSTRRRRGSWRRREKEERNTNPNQAKSSQAHLPLLTCPPGT